LSLSISRSFTAALSIQLETGFDFPSSGSKYVLNLGRSKFPPASSGQITKSSAITCRIVSGKNRQTRLGLGGYTTPVRGFVME